MISEGTLYWITGLSGAGKTTIGNHLYYEIKKQQKNVVILDGDILKNIVNDKPGYSMEERRARAMKYALLCKSLTDQGLVVICCTIAMFNEVREWNRRNNKGYVEVFINAPLNVLQLRDQKGMYSKYNEGNFKDLAGVDMSIEFPKTPDIEICNDGVMTPEECVEKILQYKNVMNTDYKRDTNYWNNYYKKGEVTTLPSSFACTIGESLEPGKSMLELGCGNGRDSIYFMNLGLNVTAIDASDYIIQDLKQKYKNRNIWFVCDDFVCSTIVKAAQYHYIYSRFTLHAIDERQEDELLHNVYLALKEGGKFFVEARGVNDVLFGKGKKVSKNAFIYDGHYRRFIEKQELLAKLISIGFEIEYEKESSGFAPSKDSDPQIIRIICRK